MSEVNLPDGWALAKIIDIADINPKKIDAEPEIKSGFVPMSHAPTDFNGVLCFDEKPWGDIKKSYTNFKDNDVIVAKVTPCFENGKAAIVQGLPNGIGAGSSEFYVIRPAIEEVSTRFLFSIVKSHKFLQEGAANMTGAVGLRRVPRAFVEMFPVSLPPLAEQKVIADKLDTLLAQVETSKARLERIPQILKTFRQSVLADAVSGKLTGKTPKKVLILENCAEILNGARVPVSATKRKSIQGEIPYYGATGIVDYLNSFTHDGRFLLVGEDGANLLSKSKDLAFIAEGKIWVNNHAHVLKEKEGFDLDYFKIVINALDLTPWVTGSAQPKLTKRALVELPIPDFTLEEQTQIVRRVEELFAFADRIEQKAHAALERVNNLTQSILAKAFRGELTADWRAANPELISGDNSAEALLKKIKAERAALAAKKPSKKKVNA